MAVLKTFGGIAFFFLGTIARVTTAGDIDWTYSDVQENTSDLSAASITSTATARMYLTTPTLDARITTYASVKSGETEEGDLSEASWLSGVPERRPSDEETLLKQLFDGYNPSARPVINSADTVNVQMDFSLIHIKDLDIRSQIFTTTGLLIMDWKDERLIWNKEEHNNMTDIAIEAKSLWTPEFAVINGAEKIYENYSQFRVLVSHDGFVHWEPGGVFKTLCQIDITNYPFDSQRCHLTFGAWSYHTSKMNLSNANVTVNVDSYSKNGEWQIVDTSVQRNEFSYESMPDDRFANIQFFVCIRRRHTFYIVNVILPNIMTTVLLLSIFFCTPAQKVQICVVVLLSFRIFLLNVAGNIPKTSDHIPLLVIYLSCTMAITTLSMVLTVLVLNLHHLTDYPVPPWMKRLVLGYLARVLCMRARQVPYHRKNYRRDTHSTIDAECEERVAILELANRSRHPADNGGDAKQDHVNCVTSSTETVDKEDSEDYSKDWRALADIIDRLFFWCFLIATLVTTLVLFHPLTNQLINPKDIN